MGKAAFRALTLVQAGVVAAGLGNAAGEEFQHPAHMGKRRLKRGEGLGRGNGGGNSRTRFLVS